MTLLQNNIERLRSDRGWTQTELAIRSGIPRNNLNRLIHGRKTITVESAAKLASAFGISLSDLFSENLEFAGELN